MKTTKIYKGGGKHTKKHNQSGRKESQRAHQTSIRAQANAIPPKKARQSQKSKGQSQKSKRKSRQSKGTKNAPEKKLYEPRKKKDDPVVSFKPGMVRRPDTVDEAIDTLNRMTQRVFSADLNGFLKKNQIQKFNFEKNSSAQMAGKIVGFLLGLQYCALPDGMKLTQSSSLQKMKGVNLEPLDPLNDEPEKKIENALVSMGTDFAQKECGKSGAGACEEQCESVPNAVTCSLDTLQPCHFQGRRLSDDKHRLLLNQGSKDELLKIIYEEFTTVAINGGMSFSQACEVMKNKDMVIAFSGDIAVLTPVKPTLPSCHIGPACALNIFGAVDLFLKGMVTLHNDNEHNVAILEMVEETCNELGTSTVFGISEANSKSEKLLTLNGGFIPVILKLTAVQTRLTEKFIEYEKKHCKTPDFKDSWFNHMGDLDKHLIDAALCSVATTSCFSEANKKFKEKLQRGFGFFRNKAVTANGTVLNNVENAVTAATENPLLTKECLREAIVNGMALDTSVVRVCHKSRTSPASRLINAIWRQATTDEPKNDSHKCIQLSKKNQYKNGISVVECLDKVILLGNKNHGTIVERLLEHHAQLDKRSAAAQDIERKVGLNPGNNEVTRQRKYAIYFLAHPEELDKFRSEVDELGSGVGGLESEVGELGSEVGELGSGVGELGSEVGELGSEVGGLGSGVGGLESEVGGLGSGVGGFDSRVGGLGSRFGQLGSQVSALGSRLGAALGSVTSLWGAPVPASGAGDGGGGGSKHSVAPLPFLLLTKEELTHGLTLSDQERSRIYLFDLIHNANVNKIREILTRLDLNHSNPIQNLIDYMTTDKFSIIKIYWYCINRIL